MPKPVRTIAALLLASTFGHAALAQEARSVGPGPGGGGGSGRDHPGAYASPSAIPEDPASVDLGIPSQQGLRRFEPIELPQVPDDGDFPAALALPALPTVGPEPRPIDHILRRSDSVLILDATLGANGPKIPDQLVWRLFSPDRQRDGKLPIVAVAKGGEAVFDVPKGTYLLHLGYGRAGATRRIDFSGERTQETVALEAGGLRLNAKSAGSDVPADKLLFDIFTVPGEGQDRQRVAKDVKPGVVQRLNAGTYRVVCRYGALNATSHADVQVSTGRVTDATIEQRAAQVTLKLVREHDGEAIADTGWVITDLQGDEIDKSRSEGAFPSMILAEGDYVVIASNRGRIFQRQFRVDAGADTEIEVLTADLVDPTNPDIGTGD